MKIQPSLPVPGYNKPAGSPVQRKRESSPKNINTTSVNLAADVLVREKQEKVITYSKPAGKPDHVTMEKLREEAGRASASLKEIIVELLERQGYFVQRLGQEEIGDIEIDATARAEAASLVAEDGPLGAEAVSDRIVDFAKAISGGDKTRIAELREAITEGFRQAEEILGTLPEVSAKTYDLVMEKLAAWEVGG